MRQFGEAPGVPGFDLTPLEAPFPVAVALSGPVHAAVRIEAKHVLHGDDADRGNRSGSGADQRPMDGAAVGVEVTAYIVLLVRAERVPPAEVGVVVVGAGIDDGVRRKVMRQVEVVALAIESKLQDAHAGQTDGTAQGNDFRGEDAEIFGEDFWGAAVRAVHLVEQAGLANGIEEGEAGPRLPVAVNGHLRIGGNFPVGLKAAEVVDAHAVAE